VGFFLLLLVIFIKVVPIPLVLAGRYFVFKRFFLLACGFGCSLCLGFGRFLFRLALALFLFFLGAPLFFLLLG